MRISLGDASLWFDVSGPWWSRSGSHDGQVRPGAAGGGFPGAVLRPAGPRPQRSQQRRVLERADWRTCGACATRSGYASRSCSAAASAGTSCSPTRGCSPDHPGAVILANTNGGRTDQQRVIEAFGRLGGARLQVAISSACRTGLAEPAEQVTGPLGGGRRPSAACGRPRVNDLDAGAIEVRQVASGKYRAAGAADGGDKSVETSDRLPSSLAGTGNNRVLLSSSCIDWQDLLIEGPEGVVRGI